MEILGGNERLQYKVIIPQRDILNKRVWTTSCLYLGKHKPCMRPFLYARLLLYVLNHHIFVRRPRKTDSILKIASHWESGDYCLQNPGLEFLCT